MTPTETITILRQFNEWRRGDDDIPQFDPRKIGKAIDAAVEMIDRLEAAESSVAWHQRRWMALQMHQKKMREPERTIVCDIIANGDLMHPTVAGDRYALPGAQPAPSVPECPYPCGWRNLLKYALVDGSFLARSINEDEPVTENGRAVTMRMVMRLRDVLMAINNAAPEIKT